MTGDCYVLLWIENIDAFSPTGCEQCWIVYIPSLQVFCQWLLVQQRGKGLMPRYMPQHCYGTEERSSMLRYNAKKCIYFFS